MRLRILSFNTLSTLRLEITMDSQDASPLKIILIIAIIILSIPLAAIAGIFSNSKPTTTFDRF